MEFLTVFLGGLLGSGHCIGMCGGFAFAVGSGSPNGWMQLQRQLCFSTGRVFTYSVAGSVAGFAGWKATRATLPIMHAQAWLAAGAGVVLVLTGLHAAGVLSRKRVVWSQGCFAVNIFGSLASRSQRQKAFLTGMLTGFLPCGLVYAHLALAASSGGWLAGWLRMALFGLGTVPLMVLAACGGVAFSPARRQRLLRVAAWCVVLTGLLSLARGYSALCSPATPERPVCPVCE